MPSGLLILPFLGGFIFLLSFRYTRFVLVRSEARRLIIFSSIIGVLLAVIARLLVSLLNEISPAIGLFWKSIFSLNMSGTAAISFVVGLPIAMLFNAFFKREKAQYLSIQHFGHHLDKLFYECLVNKKQIQLTLNDGKHYVGYLRQAPAEIGGENSYFTLIPTISGFRDPTSKKVIINTSYIDILEALEDKEFADMAGLERDDFRKYLRAQDLIMASVYDPDVSEFFKDQDDNTEWDAELQKAFDNL